MSFIICSLASVITYAETEGSEEKTQIEVFRFTGEGGVALSMYNTDEVRCLLSSLSLLFSF